MAGRLGHTRNDLGRVLWASPQLAFRTYPQSVSLFGLNCDYNAVGLTRFEFAVNRASSCQASGG
jgi:hypothetical protein